jgi:hypothetical protein
MKTENIVAISFVLGALTGIAVLIWIVFFPPLSWREDPRFSTYSKDRTISDLGPAWQVYCPKE